LEEEFPPPTGFRVQGLGSRVEGLGFSLEEEFPPPIRFRIQGFGFRVEFESGISSTYGI